MTKSAGTTQPLWHGYLRDRRFWLVQTLILGLAGAHTAAEVLLPWPRYTGLYFVPEALFLIPVGYAALNFGLHGSLATAIWCTVLTLPNLLLWHVGDEAGILFQLIVLNGVAFFVGQRVDQEVSARRERDQAHTALLYSEVRYRALFQASGDAILVCGTDGIIREANLAAAKVFDRHQESMTGLALPELAGPDGARLIAEHCPSGSPGKTCDLVYRRPDGAEVWLEATCTRVVGGRGELLVQASLRDVTQQRKRQKELHSFAAHMLQAQEDERRRISQELHDETLQGLILLCRRLDAIEEGTHSLPEAAVEGIRSARLATEEMVGVLRNFTRDLRPPALDDLGVVATVRRLLDDLETRSGINWNLSVQGTVRRLHTDAELGIFRIVQESVRNVERHAEAQSVRVMIAFHPDGLELLVQDDGKGFVTPGGIQGAVQGLGLIGMQERAALLGGTLCIRSSPGRGTTVSMKLGVRPQ